MIPTGSCICALGHQLVVLFHKVVELLGGGALMEEVPNWECAGLRLYGMAPLPVHSLLPDCGRSVNSLLADPTTVPFPSRLSVSLFNCFLSGVLSQQPVWLHLPIKAISPPRRGCPPKPRNHVAPPSSGDRHDRSVLTMCFLGFPW